MLPGSDRTPLDFQPISAKSLNLTATTNGSAFDESTISNTVVYMATWMMPRGCWNALPPTPTVPSQPATGKHASLEQIERVVP